MKKYIKQNLSKRQYELLRMLAYEWKRWKCRIGAPRQYQPDVKKLHLGCGDRHLTGWLNVDLWNSDLNLDIATGKLPFPKEHFEHVVSQHVIEHLTIEDELIPLLSSVYECMCTGGNLWLSTPDMEKAARSYIQYNNSDMVSDRQKRLPNWNLGEMPSQHFLNDLFHQQLEHRNLFDLTLLTYVLNKAGFMNVERVTEQDLLLAYPDFPPRNDDYQSIYVKATK